ncbi:M48 family metallopeptidase [Sphingomonas sp. 28-63-12]|uniref:M48 family metallopeptidase n=1 Tax=Sphingomonas sp. 28-63-12 TaxID=1970434 RepID=UPI000BCB481D|nr:MAG: hypothetical protein B7Y47_08590 [Sphingomonas sp. 28-63-12]
MRARPGIGLVPSVIALGLSGIAAAAEPQSSKPAQPPYAGAYQPSSVDERGLWMLVDEEERRLRDSPFLMTDAALNLYVRQVLCRTVGEERCRAVRLYIERVPEFNASMMPNGGLQLLTGLLLRVRNEAELAAILAHEFAHFEERHSLAKFRLERRNTDIALWAGLLGSATVQSAAIGGIFSFSRAEEKAADVRAVSYLAASPYRVAAFADIWARLLDEADATSAGRRQRSKRYKPAGFFATHPAALERETYIRALADQTGGGGIDNEAAYRQAIASWWPLLIDDQIKGNDFAGTEYLLNQHAAGGWTADLLLARGELYRQRGHPRDLIAAAGFYQEAIAKGGTRPVLWRGLGLALLRSRAASEGRAALQTYLARAPDAGDAALIAALIDSPPSPTAAPR